MYAFRNSSIIRLIYFRLIRDVRSTKLQKHFPRFLRICYVTLGFFRFKNTRKIRKRGIHVNSKRTYNNLYDASDHFDELKNYGPTVENRMFLLVRFEISVKKSRAEIRSRSRNLIRGRQQRELSPVTRIIFSLSCNT